MGGKYAPSSDAARTSAFPTAMNQGKRHKDDSYYSPQQCRHRRSDPSVDQLIQFVRSNQILQRETTEMRLMRKAPLPGIGQSLTPRSNKNPTSTIAAPQHNQNDTDVRFNDDELDRVTISSDDSDSDLDISATYGPRMRTPSPPRSFALNPVGHKLSNSSSHLVPTKPQRKNKRPVFKLNAKNKRFESIQRRPTADVHYLPPIIRNDVPDRPSAPRPNWTPPLLESDDDCYNSTILEEPIDYIDQD